MWDRDRQCRTFRIDICRTSTVFVLRVGQDGTTVELQFWPYHAKKKAVFKLLSQVLVLICRKAMTFTNPCKVVAVARFQLIRRPAARQMAKPPQSGQMVWTGVQQQLLTPSLLLEIERLRTEAHQIRVSLRSHRAL